MTEVTSEGDTVTCSAKLNPAMPPPIIYHARELLKSAKHSRFLEVRSRQQRSCFMLWKCEKSSRFPRHVLVCDPTKMAWGILKLHCCDANKKTETVHWRKTVYKLQAFPPPYKSGRAQHLDRRLSEIFSSVWWAKAMSESGR